MKLGLILKVVTFIPWLKNMDVSDATEISNPGHF